MRFLTALLSAGLALTLPAAADDIPNGMAKTATDLASPETPAPSTDGDMTVERLNELIVGIDPTAERAAGRDRWMLTVDGVDARVIADPEHDRMRVLVAVVALDSIDAEVVYRMMQANFDTALDARYAIAQGFVWTTYIHPLASLRDTQFVSGLSQTVTLAKTAGSTYSSGALSFGGGDSGRLLQDELIERLKERGVPI